MCYIQKQYLTEAFFYYLSLKKFFFFIPVIA